MTDRDELDEIREAASMVLSYMHPSGRQAKDHEVSEAAEQCARVVQATPEALMRVALEAHTLGRLYNQMEEPETPAEYVERLKEAIRQYAHPVLAKAWRGEG